MDTIVNVFRDLMYGLVKVFFITCVASVICFAQDEKDKAIELLSLYQKISQANTRSDLVPDDEVSSSIEKSLKKIMHRVHPDRVYKNFQVDDLPAYLEEIRSNSKFKKTLPKITKEFILEMAQKAISIRNNEYVNSNSSNWSTNSNAFFYFEVAVKDKFQQVFSGNEFARFGFTEKESEYFEKIDLREIYRRFIDQGVMVDLERAGSESNFRELLKGKIFHSSLKLAMYAIVLNLDLEIEKRIDIEDRFLKEIKEALGEYSSLLPQIESAEMNSRSPDSFTSRILTAMELVSLYMKEANFTVKFQKSLSRYITINGRWLGIRAEYIESEKGFYRALLILSLTTLSAYISPDLAKAHPFIYGGTSFALVAYLVNRYTKGIRVKDLVSIFRTKYPSFSDSSKSCAKSGKRLN